MMTQQSLTLTLSDNKTQVTLFLHNDVLDFYWEYVVDGEVTAGGPGLPALTLQDFRKVNEAVDQFYRSV